MLKQIKILIIVLFSCQLLLCFSCSIKQYSDKKISTPKMMLVKAGSYRIGEGGGAWPWANGPRPIKDISIDYDFYISAKPVSINQWNECVFSRQCTPLENHQYHSSNSAKVSWDDSQDYIRWLNRVTDLKTRLPTETEWEFAIRGIKPIPEKWYNIENKAPMTDKNFINDRGVFPLLGMHGEWVQDCWKLFYHDLPVDGSARINGDCNRRVFKNSGNNYEFRVLLHGRSHFYKDLRGSNISFRIVYKK